MTANPNYLEMSDEDWLNAPPPADDDEGVTNREDKDNDGKDQTPVAGDDDQDQGDVEDDQKNDDVNDSGSVPDEADDKSGSVEDTDASKSDDEDGDTSTDDEETPEGKEKTKGESNKESDNAAVVNYEAEYKRFMAPFKANGREIAVKNVDDAIALMQMGANYNKKMAALKPSFKILKMLENNNLLDESKLGFLIDLDKKNPDAINKLVKDSGLDPMDLDTDKASEYKQTSYTVDERELALDTVLRELEGSPTYNRTLDVIGNKWDVASKQVIADAPQLIKVINDHMDSGIYDMIASEVERERMLGRLTGLSDLEAYRQVGDSINARGGFNDLVQGSSQNQTQTTTGTKQITNPKPVEDDKLKDRKRAASSTKPAAQTTTRQKVNPLSLSDEEFAKINPEYI